MKLKKRMESIFSTASEIWLVCLICAMKLFNNRRSRRRVFPNGVSTASFAAPTINTGNSLGTPQGLLGPGRLTLISSVQYSLKEVNLF